jgi:hypothetical protein
LLAAPDPRVPPQPEREAPVAALTGALGDHLAATDNPVAITMNFRRSGRSLSLGRFEVRGRRSSPPVAGAVHRPAGRGAPTRRCCAAQRMPARAGWWPSGSSTSSARVSLAKPSRMPT